MHSVCADYQEVGTGPPNGIACLDKNASYVIPAAFMLSSLNLIKI
jgi:hypothetical protein